MIPTSPASEPEASRTIGKRLAADLRGVGLVGLGVGKALGAEGFGRVVRGAPAVVGHVDRGGRPVAAPEAEVLGQAVLLAHLEVVFLVPPPGGRACRCPPGCRRARCRASGSIASSSWQRVQNFSGTPCSWQSSPMSSAVDRTPAKWAQVGSQAGRAVAMLRPMRAEPARAASVKMRMRLIGTVPATRVSGKDSRRRAGRSPRVGHGDGTRWAGGPGMGRGHGASVARSAARSREGRAVQQRKFWRKARTVRSSPRLASPAGEPSQVRWARSGAVVAMASAIRMGWTKRSGFARRIGSA